MQPTRKIDLEQIEREGGDAQALLEVLESQCTEQAADADAVLGPRFTASGAKMA